MPNQANLLTGSPSRKTKPFGALRGLLGIGVSSPKELARLSPKAAQHERRVVPCLHGESKRGDVVPASLELFDERRVISYATRVFRVVAAAAALATEHGIGEMSVRL